MIEQHWYHRPRLILNYLLAPFEALFRVASSLRRLAFQRGWLRSTRLPVPVVVIGNINVGGTGKTPLTLALLSCLQQRGIQVGVISRGYGGYHQAPTYVQADSLPQHVGDEPLLLAASGVPVVVGRDRVAAGYDLLQRCPDLQIILSDDGLQHYRLARQLEIVVLDTARLWGNGRLLPAGPLREPLSRLQTVDALVLNGDQPVAGLPAAVPCFTMHLVTNRQHPFYSLSGQLGQVQDFVGKAVIALAGIGHPDRFFNTLKQLGVHLQRCIGLPDHHMWQEADLPQGADAIIITTKDAVKLSKVIHDSVLRGKLWVLTVRAVVEPDLSDWILDGCQISRHSSVSSVQGDAGAS